MLPAPAYVLLALAAGALLAAQGPIFARLAVHAGGPVQAAIVAFATALLALLILGVATGTGLPRFAGLARMPAWLWTGGLIGMAMVLLSIHAVPRIGVAVFVAAVVCGQLIAALAYDHTGAFGLELPAHGERGSRRVLCLAVNRRIRRHGDGRRHRPHHDFHRPGSAVDQRVRAGGIFAPAR